MKEFFNNNTFLISMGTGIPSSPELSIEAFRKSIQLGANVISAGIALNKGKVVLKQEIYKKTDETLDEAVSLDILLDEFPDMLFNFVILEKNDLLIDQFCDIVQQKNMKERIIIRSIYKKNIKKVKAKLPGIACAFSLMDIIGFYALYKTGLISLKKKFSCDAIMTTEMIGTSYFASPGVLNAAKKFGLKVYIIGAKSKAEIEKLSHAGVDGFFTENVEEFIKICTELKVM